MAEGVFSLIVIGLPHKTSGDQGLNIHQKRCTGPGDLEADIGGSREPVIKESEIQET